MINKGNFAGGGGLFARDLLKPVCTVFCFLSAEKPD